MFNIPGITGIGLSSGNLRASNANNNNQQQMRNTRTIINDQDGYETFTNSDVSSSSSEESIDPVMLSSRIHRPNSGIDSFTTANLKALHTGASSPRNQDITTAVHSVPHVKQTVLPVGGTANRQIPSNNVSNSNIPSNGCISQNVTDETSNMSNAPFKSVGSFTKSGMQTSVIYNRPVQHTHESVEELPLQNPNPKSMNSTALTLTSQALSLRGMQVVPRNLNFITPMKLFSRRTCNILVIGGLQVGKSSLINFYRSAVTHNERWPMASVGICGKYGTCSVEPCPNNPISPSWLLIDTPGKTYVNLESDESDDSILLSCLFEGVQWGTTLVGKGAKTVASLSQEEPIPSHRAHQSILVLNASDLIVDNGRFASIKWATRFEPQPQVNRVIEYLQSFLQKIRELQNDIPPFVVVTKMDKVGGVDCKGARDAILQSLRQCAPVNCVYFAACPSSDPGASGRDKMASLEIDTPTRQELLRLHQDVICSVSWQICQNPQEMNDLFMRENS
eukprot:Tbor_TRINITY_DN6045_c3_g1::TRINITY_DN6045_c3_g1_i1::g.11448::m.11448